MEKKNAAVAALRLLYPSNSTIKRVLLVAPPDADEGLFDYKTAVRGRYWNFPPYGLGIIARLLIDDGLDVRIVNLNHEILKVSREGNGEDFDFQETWKSRLKLELELFFPDFIGVTCMFTQGHNITSQVCSFIKTSNPQIPLALGGVHITNCFAARNFLGHLLHDFSKLDIYFLYEAEYAVRNFIRTVNKKMAVDLFQIHFTKENLTYETRLLPTKEELDVIPAHDLMNTTELSRYGVIGSFYCLKAPETLFSTIISNRGCRGSCTFCSVRGFNGKGVRSRSVKSVVDELQYLQKEFNIGHVMWLDDDFLYDTKRAISLFNEMVYRNIQVTWDCTNGVIAASCQEEVIAAAVASGCIGLNIGVESGNEEILRSTHKPAKISDYINAASVLLRYPEINARIFLMIGFPGETIGMMHDTYKVACSMNLDWYNVTILQPLPNTPIFGMSLESSIDKQLDSGDVRYNSGAYGKQREQIQNSTTPLPNSGNIFEQWNFDYVPNRSELVIIWRWFNFHLNFKRLFFVENPIKLDQQHKYVKNICDVVAPEDPIPHYFQAYLQYRMQGHIDIKIIEKLEAVLSASEVGSRDFFKYNLSVTHLKTRCFPTA